MGNNQQAFPQLRVNAYGKLVSEDGMTLRDYFAAKFMQGFISAPDLDEKYGHVTKADCAKRAYQMADAMLAERAK